jgi:hypothetical protein
MDFGALNNKQLSDDQPETVMEIALGKTDELTPVAGHVAIFYRGCLLVWGGYYSTDITTEYRSSETLYLYPYSLAGDLNVW